MTLLELSNLLKNNLKVLLSCAAVIVGLFGHGSVSGFTSPAIPNINEDTQTPFNLDDHEASWVASINGIGSVIGLFITGYLMDTYGRKLAIMLAAVPFVFGLAIVASSPNVLLLLVGEFLAGLCLGLIQAIIYCYLSEISPANIRGMLLSFGTVSFSCGILAVYGVGSMIRWTWLAIFCSASFTLLVILMTFLPDTPRWYVMKGFKDGARESLQWLRGKNVDITNELEELHKSSCDAVSWYGFFSEKEFLKPAATTVIINIMLQFTGCGVVRQFLVTIFRSAGGNFNVHTQTIIAAAVAVFGNFVCLLTVDILGRRLLLILSSIVMAVSMGLVGVYFKIQEIHRQHAEDHYFWLPLAGLCLFNFAFSAGCDPVRYILFTEHFPTRARGKGMGVTCIAGELFRFVTLKCFVQMIYFFNVSGTFWSYAVACAVQAVLAIVILKETSGKVLD